MFTVKETHHQIQWHSQKRCFLHHVKLIAAAGIFATAFSASSSISLSALAANSLQGKTILLPIGTTFEGRLDSRISSNHSKEGERFTISMSTPVLANGSEVVIPAGSQVLGEVVEAIDASSLPHKKRMPKPYGKLRVQLSGLKTPDGATYPLIGSLAPEQWEQSSGGQVRKNQNLGGGIGYVGTDNSFNAVRPGAQSRGGKGPQLVERRDLQKHALYGKDQNTNQSGAPRIRSLMIKGHDIYIDSGSPVSIRLDAPLKIAVYAPGSAESTFEAAEQRAPRTSQRRFTPESEMPQGEGAPAGGPFTPSSLPFLNKPAQAPQGLPFLNKQPNNIAPATAPQTAPPDAPPLPPITPNGQRKNDF